MNPLPSYNLLDEPWVPVLLLDGTRSQMGYRDVLGNAQQILALDFDDPLATAVAHRHLEAIVLRSEDAPLDSEDVRVWSEWAGGVFGAGRFRGIERYLEDHHDYFWLLGGDRPFLQDPALATETPDDKVASVNKLVMRHNSGNNALFWTKVPDTEAAPIDPGAAAAALLAQAGFAAGGRVGNRSNEQGSKATSIAGPYRALSLFRLRGRTLFETLLLNLVPITGDAETAGRDACIWERPAGDRLHVGPLMRRTAVNHGFLLERHDGRVTGVRLTWGAEYSQELWHNDAAVAELHPTKKGADPRPLKISRGEEWLEAPVLVAESTKSLESRMQGSDLLRPPKLLSAEHPLSHAADPAAADAWYRARVEVTTHHCDQSKDELSVTAPLMVTAGLALRENLGLRRRLRDFAAAAATTEAVLTRALCEAFGDPNSDGTRVKNASVARVSGYTAPYWAAATNAFRVLVAANSDDALEARIDEVAEAAVAAFDSAVSVLDETNVRRARLVTRARGRLVRPLNRSKEATSP